MHFVQSELECESLKEAGGESEAASANLMRLAILILLIQFVEKTSNERLNTWLYRLRCNRIDDVMVKFESTLVFQCEMA